MCEIAIRLRQLDERRRKKQTKAQMDEEQLRTARRMRFVLYGLLAATLVLAVVDLTVMKTKNND